MREVSLMGYTFNLTIPASGGGSRPINVSGETLLMCEVSLQVAYDENGFNTGQFITLPPTQSNPKPLFFPLEGKTILWLRLNPTTAEPATTLNVWTDIGSVNL